MAESIYSSEFKLRVALGLVPGWETFRKFGVNPAVSNTSAREDVWAYSGGGVRTLPSSGGQVTITSSSTADDDTTGTGAWSVVIEGLDSNYAEISEEVTLNGTGNVTSVGTDWLRINRMYVGSLTGAQSAGTGQTNAGEITATIGGNVQAAIAATEGQTAQAMYTVPYNKWLLVDNYHVQCGRMAGSSDLHVEGEIRLVNQNAWRSISNIYLWDGQNWVNTNSVTPIPPKTEVRAQTISSATTQMAAVFGGYLVVSTEFNR